MHVNCNLLANNKVSGETGEFSDTLYVCNGHTSLAALAMVWSVETATDVRSALNVSVSRLVVKRVKVNA
jgi:hypothetical protein